MSSDTTSAKYNTDSNTREEGQSSVQVLKEMWSDNQ